MYYSISGEFLIALIADSYELNYLKMKEENDNISIEDYLYDLGFDISETKTFEDAAVTYVKTYKVEE